MGLSLTKWSTESFKLRQQCTAASLIMAAPGFCFSWYLQYVAHFKIGAFCIYCFSSACIMTLLFLTIIFDAVVAKSAAAAPSA